MPISADGRRRGEIEVIDAKEHGIKVVAKPLSKEDEMIGSFVILSEEVRVLRERVDRIEKREMKQFNERFWYKINAWCERNDLTVVIGLLCLMGLMLLLGMGTEIIIRIMEKK